MGESDRFPLRDDDPTGWDETLWEDAIPDATAEPWGDDPALRQAALEQRFVHGALRARTETAAAREARIERILAALPGGSVDAPPASRGRGWKAFGPWLATAAAAAVTIAAVWGITARSEMPLLEAAVLRKVSDELEAEPVDRHYEVEVRAQVGDAGFRLLGRHDLWVRGGGSFRMEFHGEILQGALFSNGEHVWFLEPQQASDDRLHHLTETRSLEEVQRDLGGPFRQGGFFDIGYIHLANAVRTLVGKHSIRCREYVETDAGGYFVFAAPQARGTRFGEVRDVALWVTDDFDEVDRLTFRLWCQRQRRDFEVSFVRAGVAAGPIRYEPE